MGFFTRQTKGNSELRVESLIKELNNHPDENSRRLALKINSIKNNSSEGIIKPFDLYLDCIEMILSNKNNFSRNDYIRIIEYGEQLYKQIFIYEEDTPDFEELALVFIEMFDEYSVVFRKCFDPVFFNLFSNKHNYIKWIRSLNVNDYVTSISNYYVNYAVTARSYFPDEDMFTANVISVTNKLLRAADAKAVFDEEIKNIEHMVGIYNVDEELILNAEQQIEAVKSLIDKQNNILGIVEDRIRTIDSVSKTAVENVKHICETEISVAKSQLNDVDIKLKNAYDEFVENQKNIIIYDKQQLVNSVFAEAEEKLNSLKQMAQMTLNSANLELMRINQESGNVVSKIDAYVKNDENLQKVLENAATNEALMGKIDKLMIINDQNIDQIARNIGKSVSAAESNVVGSANTGINSNLSSYTGNQDVNIYNNQMLDEQEDIFSDVNPLLDENISFKERYERVEERKIRLMEQGEHFHKMFDDVLIAVMENANPYLIGPSGCGKTYMVSQIARLLDLDFIDIGYINEEYDILGFQTANGGYSRPNFYRCYKYGKIAFCDELDNGNSRATVKLNSFLSNTEDASYSFPNGENVKRHGNFRLIAAGNTAGNGADSNYNTREKIEESVQQRFTPIYVGYDNSVEKTILGNYEDWYDFVVLFRAATDAWGESNYGDAPGIITTRDVTRIKKYLDHGSFGMDKILDYEFIQTKEVSYLAFLESFISSHVDTNMPGYTIAKEFSRKVELIRNKKS